MLFQGNENQEGRSSVRELQLQISRAMRTEVKLSNNLIKRGGLVQRVAGDGKEDVEEGVVAAEREQHEVEAVDAATVPPPALGVYGSVHHLHTRRIWSSHQARICCTFDH